MNGLPWLAAALSPWLASPATPRASVDPAVVAAVLEEELRETGTPGAALVVIDDGAVRLTRGLGVASLESGAPVTPETLFRVGSVTKMVTAATALALVDDGRLRVEARVQEFLTGLPPAFGELTLHQLLSQTSGLLDEPAESGALEESALEAYVRSWSPQRAALPPGVAFSYSNPGYDLLGLVLQAAARRPYADLVGDRLLAPLGMTRSTFRPGMAMTHPLAVGHRDHGGRTEAVRPMGDDTRHWPAGFLFSSASDVAKLVQAILDGGRANGGPVLSPAAVESMTRRWTTFPHVLDGDGYGYGLFVDDSRASRVIGHGGQMPGFSAMVKMVPARRAALIVLANREGVAFPRTVDRFLDMAAGPVAAAPVPAERPPSADDLRASPGTYRNRWAMEVTARDGRLRLRWAGADRALRKVGDGLFAVEGPKGPVTLRTVSAPGGGILGLQMFVWTFVRERSP
jgi:CubicO group peptidase (beta-lactamase class C family)